MSVHENNAREAVFKFSTQGTAVTNIVSRTGGGISNAQLRALGKAPATPALPAFSILDNGGFAGKTSLPSKFSSTRYNLARLRQRQLRFPPASCLATLSVIQECGDQWERRRKTLEKPAKLGYIPEIEGVLSQWLNATRISWQSTLPPTGENFRARRLALSNKPLEFPQVKQ